MMSPLALGERDAERARAEAAEAREAALVLKVEGLESDVVDLVTQREQLEACVAEIEWRLAHSQEELRKAEAEGPSTLATTRLRASTFDEALPDGNTIYSCAIFFFPLVVNRRL